MNIQAVAHACLKTTNLEQTEHFYCAALGLRKLFNFTREGQVIGFYLQTAGESFLEVFLVEKALPTGQPVLDHFCLETESLEAAWESLRSHGYAPREIHTGADRTRQFWVVDPNGLNVEFQQYTGQSSQRSGEDVEVNW